MGTEKNGITMADGRVIHLRELFAQIISVAPNQDIDTPVENDRIIVVGATAHSSVAPSADIDVELTYVGGDDLPKVGFRAPLRCMLEHGRRLEALREVLPLRESAAAVRSLSSQITSEVSRDLDALHSMHRPVDYREVEKFQDRIGALSKAWGEMYAAAQPMGELGAFFHGLGVLIIKGSSRAFFNLSASGHDLGPPWAPDLRFDVVAYIERDL